jgi:rubrerythrin
MKTISYKSVCLTFIMLFLISYCEAGVNAAKKKPEPKTFAYVRHAINAEKMAYNYYMACAKQARDAGSKSIASTYEIIAGQENEHYLKFIDVAKKLKIKYTEESIDVPIHTILENINKSIEIETIEAGNYAEAVKTAAKERYRNARKTFEYVLEIEKLHIEAFKNLLVRLSE